MDLLKHLDEAKIGTRLLFAGNLVRQPYMQYENYRISGELKNTDYEMENSFWIGVYPGINQEMLNFVANKIKSFFGDDN